jgi:hypothetical protein
VKHLVGEDHILYGERNMKKFLLHWKGGFAPEKIEGEDIGQALALAGYGEAAITALDYWEEVEKGEKHRCNAPSVREH